MCMYVSKITGMYTCTYNYIHNMYIYMYILCPGPLEIDPWKQLESQPPPQECIVSQKQPSFAAELTTLKLNPKP